ncbi:MAG: hypothetical protein AAFY88_29555, partial [Acidobacteriota bacterium]
TGVVALMLEKNPRLTQAEIRRALEQSARTDASTGGVPNRSWGFGKLDAEGALKHTPAASEPADGGGEEGKDTCDARPPLPRRVI